MTRAFSCGPACSHLQRFIRLRHSGHTFGDPYRGAWKGLWQTSQRRQSRRSSSVWSRTR